MPDPIRGVAYDFTLTLIDAATGALRANPTLAAGDFQVSQDHGALVNLATLPTVAPAGSALVRVQLSATEMTVTQQVDVVAHDPDGQWDDVTVQIQPTRTLGTDFKTLLSADAQTGVVLPRVTLADTITAYTGDTPQSGDAYARLGTPAGASVSADVAAVHADTGTLTTRLTAARAAYLDTLNVGGPVASRADVEALNQSASRRLVLTTVQQFERPETGSVLYTVELRTYDGDGAAVNADTPPTLTATGSLSGDLSLALFPVAQPALGVSRWMYTVSSVATLEQIRFDVSALLGGSTFTLSAYAQVLDVVSATWSTTDAAHLTAVFNKLPSKNYLVGTANPDGDVQLDEATGAVARVTLTDTVTTYTGNTPQTGDAFVRLGAPAGASVSADVAGVKTDTNALLARLTALRAGFLDNLGIGDLVASQSTVDQVKAKTDALPPDPADASVLAASFSALSAELATIAGYIDTEVAAIKAKTDNLPPQPAAVGSPMTLAANAVTAVALAAAACEKMADILARRHTSAIEASPDGEALAINSLYGLMAIGSGHRRDTTSHQGSLTVYRVNGTTELAQIPLVMDDAAEPIVSAGG